MDSLVEEWLAAARSASRDTGVFIDFDGTLSPIVDDPDAAAPHPDAARVLGLLAGRLGRVAVVSGRPVAYLASHLAAARGTLLFGLYGLERGRAGADGVDVVPEAEVWRDAVDDVAAEAERRRPAGVGVERKGLTVTLHYRAAPAEAGWVEGFAADQASRRGVVAHAGKMSVEIRPPVAVDKGTIVRELSGGLTVVMFVGDDLGDLPAFAELARLRAAGTVTLGVASGGSETPDDVIDAADITVDGPAGVVGLLQRLAA
jgi:trehalose 6-phosphate phosphatase